MMRIGVERPGNKRNVRSDDREVTRLDYDLRAIVDERRELERQRRLHLWLHAWLFVHVPLSYAMLVFTVWHIIGALRFASVGG